MRHNHSPGINRCFTCSKPGQTAHPPALARAKQMSRCGAKGESNGLKARRGRKDFGILGLFQGFISEGSFWALNMVRALRICEGNIRG